MYKWPFSRDVNELIFRSLFSTIFIGLGGEHIVADDLIQNMMPSWVPMPRVVSILSGVILLTGGFMTRLGIMIHRAAYILGSFLIVVTLTVHVPACFIIPPEVTPDTAWMWTVLQRSNLVKNMCLLGVCFWLGYHKVGRYSWAGLMDRNTSPNPGA